MASLEHVAQAAQAEVCDKVRAAQDAEAAGRVAGQVIADMLREELAPLTRFLALFNSQ